LSVVQRFEQIAVAPVRVDRNSKAPACHSQLLVFATSRGASATDLECYEKYILNNCFPSRNFISSTLHPPLSKATARVECRMQPLGMNFA
jgi:hypothetical protein